MSVTRSNDISKIGTITVAALITALLPPTAEAGTVRADGRPVPTTQRSINTSGELSAVNTKTRPCPDFLNAQGTMVRFFPPVPDYVGWTDKPFTTFGLIDYAGLAAEYIKDQTQKSLGTKVTCSVTEGALDDGTAKISVTVFTTNALGFAQSKKIGLDKPTIFGAKAQDVVDGAEPALGQATLGVSFRTEAPGVNLPDLVDVLVDNPCNYAPINFTFESSTYGKRSDGTNALLQISQVGSPGKKPSCLDFTKEVVEIVPAQ